MILDRLENAERYAGLHAGLARGLAFLKQIDPSQLPMGRVEIDGDRLYGITAQVAARSRSEARLETHRRYIDIQYVISGIDSIGWQARGACHHPLAPYDAQSDLEFFGDAAASWVEVHAGEFAVFFPEDAHAPLVGTGEIRKIVVKVAL